MSFEHWPAAWSLHRPRLESVTFLQQHTKCKGLQAHHRKDEGAKGVTIRTEPVTVERCTGIPKMPPARARMPTPRERVRGQETQDNCDMQYPTARHGAVF